jgi:hypothetical protein
MTAQGTRLCETRQHGGSGEAVAGRSSRRRRWPCCAVGRWVRATVTRSALSKGLLGKVAEIDQDGDPHRRSRTGCRAVAIQGELWQHVGALAGG